MKKGSLSSGAIGDWPVWVDQVSGLLGKKAQEWVTEHEAFKKITITGIGRGVVTDESVVVGQKSKSSLIQELS